MTQYSPPCQHNSLLLYQAYTQAPSTDPQAAYTIWRTAQMLPKVVTHNIKRRLYIQSTDLLNIHKNAPCSMCMPYNHPQLTARNYCKQQETNCNICSAYLATRITTERLGPIRKVALADVGPRQTWQVSQQHLVCLHSCIRHLSRLWNKCACSRRAHHQVHQQMP